MSTTMSKIRLSNFFLMVILPLALLSCQTQDKVSQFKVTIEEAINNANNITADEWQRYDLEVDNMRQKIKEERESFTEQEIKEINKLIGKYYAIKASQKASQKATELKQDLKDVKQQIEGMWEMFFKSDTTNK
jgi:hypothetical protein